MSYKWDDKLIEKFLTLYRKHQCLWNPYSPDYRNCSVKNAAFKIIVQELNDPRIRISECLQQIEIIREKYKREQLKAEQELKWGKLYTSKLPWYNLMSQMLCEVINDEENFSAEPARIVPCTITKREQDKDYGSAFAQEESSTFLHEPEKYVECRFKQSNSNTCITSEEELGHVNSGLEKPPNGQSGNNNLQLETKTVNGENCQWNRCPYCRWKEQQNQGSPYIEANQFNNCQEREVQIDFKVEVPLQCNKTTAFDTNNEIGEVNQPTTPSRRTPETDIIQNRKKVQINADPSQGCRAKYDSVERKKCNITEDKVPHRDDCSKAKNLLELILLNENNVHCPQGDNEFKKNAVMCPSRIDDSDRRHCLENQLSNFQTNPTNHCINKPTPNFVVYQDTFTQQSQKVSKFADEKDGDKNMSANGCNSSIREFGEGIEKFATLSEEDKYEISSRFKIIIPSSDREDQNLEITGYEVRVINPQLSKYIISPNSETPKLAINNAECPCKTDFSLAKENANANPASYGSIIKMDINPKRLNEIQAKKRLCTTGTTCTGLTTNSMIDCVSEIEAQKSFSNKKTQTDKCYENKSIQNIRDMETSKFSSLKSVKYQGCAMNVSSMNGKSCQDAALNESENFLEQHQSIEKDDSIVIENALSCSQPPKIENSLLPAGKFHNTRKFLNVIIKMLESDDIRDKSEDLQTTLDTMLDRFREMSKSAEIAAKHRTDGDSKDSMCNDTSLSTQYQSLQALNLASANRQATNINSPKSTNKTVELDETTPKLRPQTVELDDTATNLSLQSLVLAERNNAETKEVSGSTGGSGPLSETDKSIDERGTRSGANASLVDNTNMSNFKNDSVLNYTSDFLNEEPIASSSRKFKENRTPSQLTKDFLDVIKYTMLMDGIQPLEEDGNNNCCKKAKESTDPRHHKND